MSIKKTYPLSIYLVKEDVVNDQDILVPDLESINITWIWKIHYKKSNPQTPTWCTLFWVNHFSHITANSVSWVFIASKSWRKFAITFGQWWRFLLNKWVCEEKFGFITTLNSVKADSLKSLDIVDMDSVGLKKRLQSAQSDFSDSFGIDIEKDLVKAVTWETIDHNTYWKFLTWKESLSTRINTDIHQLYDYLWSFLERFESQDYLEKFPWINNIKEVSKQNISALDEILIETIESWDYEQLLLTIPDIQDRTEFWYFCFKLWKRGDIPLYEDLDFSHFVAHMQKKDRELSIKNIKKEKVYMRKYGEESIIDHWNVYRCIHYELSRDWKTYILNGGKRYQIVNDLLVKVNEYFESFPKFTCELVCDDRFHDENAFNIKFTDEIGGVCLDAQNIIVQWYSKFEFCDILAPNNTLYHVKRYYWSSSLSHLFLQWLVSWRSFLDRELRQKIDDKIRQNNPSFWITDLDERPSGYKIIFWIIKKKEDIPFFSKLTMMRVCKELELLWYEVSLMFIKDEKTKATTWVAQKTTE